MGHRERGIGGIGIAGILLGVVAAGALFMLVAWPLFPVDGTGVSASAIVDDLQGYIGTRVTVEGAVARKIGPHAFTITEDGLLGPLGGEVLVVSRESVELPLDRPGALGVTAGDTVEVTGPVRRFDLADLERDLGTPFDLGEFADWEGRPAILVDRLVVTTGGHRLVADPARDGGQS